MEDYKILQANNIESLQKKVNESRVLGYTLRGNLIILDNALNVLQYTQVMEMTIDTNIVFKEVGKEDKKISVEKFMSPPEKKKKKKTLADDYASVGGPKKQQSDFEFGVDYEFKNGKHAGKSLYDVIQDDAQYLNWLVNEKGFKIDDETYSLMKENL